MIQYNGLSRPDDFALIEEVEKEYFWNRIDFSRVHHALDIGAHIGIWSWLLKQYAPHCEVLAIEPHDGNYAVLQQNAIALRQVTALHGWCGYREGNVYLHCPEGASGSNYVGEFVIARRNVTIMELLSRYNLEALTAGVTRDLLKIDCEGSEFDILLNCKSETLKQFHYIVGEYHLDFGDFYTTIANRLAVLDFELTIKPTAPHLGMFFAERNV